MALGTAAAMLRERRREAGLTQEQLAARSGVSDRTIRTLEGGTARRPHRDTLLAIAHALGLPTVELDNFVAAWRDGVRRVNDLFDGEPSFEVLTAEFALQNEMVHDVAVHHTTVIDAHGLIERTTSRRTIRVVADDVDGFIWMNEVEPFMDGDAVEVTGCANIECVSSVLVPEVSGKVFAGTFGRTLPPGLGYTFEYTVDFASAYLGGRTEVHRQVRDMAGLLRPLASCLIEVRFDPAFLPRRVRQVSGDTLTAVEQVVRPLDVSPFGIAQIDVRPAPAGMHGIRWDWD